MLQLQRLVRPILLESVSLLWRAWLWLIQDLPTIADETVRVDLLGVVEFERILHKSEALVALMRCSSIVIFILVQRKLHLLHLVLRAASLRVSTFDLVAECVLYFLVGEVSANIPWMLSILLLDLNIRALTHSWNFLIWNESLSTVFVSVDLSDSSLTWTISSLDSIRSKLRHSRSRAESSTLVLLPWIVCEYLFGEEASTIDINLLLNDFVANCVVEHV